MTHDLSGLQRLAVRRNQVLAAMSVLSDSPGASWVVTTKYKPKATTKAPSKQGTGSIYWEWRTRFDEDWPDTPDDPDEAALDWCYDRANRLVLEAESDYNLRTGKTRMSVDGDAGERDKRIIKEHEGRPAVEVAILERCSTASVRATRRQFGRDALTGVRSKRGK